MLSPTLDTIRLFLHLLAAGVWVGGQIVLAGVVPRLRSIDVEGPAPGEAGSAATKAAANGFATVAWPAFAIAFVTGIWNILEQPTNQSTAYNAALGIKLLLVVAAGFSAAQHARTSNRGMKALTGAFGLLAALAILFLGVLLTTGA